MGIGVTTNMTRFELGVGRVVMKEAKETFMLEPWSVDLLGQKAYLVSCGMTNRIAKVESRSSGN